MFTGIIESTGTIAQLDKKSSDLKITITCESFDLSATKQGDSIAVNGVCLTVIDLNAKHFVADVSSETLSKTTLSQLAEGDKVNLEKPVTLNTVLGGHMVSGHVDGVATVVSHHADGRSERYTFETEAGLSKYIAQKGSVCIDGVSLTVNDVNQHQFSVNIIPHTAQKTIFNQYEAGSRVNIEVDIIARYLERLTQHDA